MADGNPEKLKGKLIESIKIKGLGELAQEYIELGLDLITNDGVLRDIPIVGTIVKVSQIVGGVRDRLYAVKLVRFLQKVGETTPEQREKFIKDNCKDTKQFEESVLLILEQADALEKSSLIGKVFKSCILGMISYQNALALSSMINKAIWQDIGDMLQGNITEESKMRLCNSGLLTLSWRRLTHVDETKKPVEIGSTFDGFNYLENQYSQILREIAKV